VAGVAHHGYHPQGLAPATTVWVPHQPQAPEIRLGYFPGLGIRHAHRRLGAFAKPAPPEDKTSQRHVGHQTVVLSQKLLDTGELEFILLQPSLNLVNPGLKYLVGGYHHLARPSPV